MAMIKKINKPKHSYSDEKALTLKRISFHFILITNVFIYISCSLNTVCSMNPFNLIRISIIWKPTVDSIWGNNQDAVYLIYLIDFKLIWSLTFDPLGVKKNANQNDLISECVIIEDDVWNWHFHLRKIDRARYQYSDSNFREIQLPEKKTNPTKIPTSTFFVHKDWA